MNETKPRPLFRNIGAVWFVALLAILVEAAFQAAPSKEVPRESLVPTERMELVSWDNTRLSHPTKNIEDIQIGDVVMSMDDKTGEVLPKRVARVYKNYVDHVYAVTILAADGLSESTIRATGVHPFFVPGRGWVEASELSSGCLLFQADEKLSTVVSVVREDLVKPEAVYNFEVEDFHTYFVAGSAFDPPVLAHNANCQGIRRRQNGQFAKKPGPKTTKPTFTDSERRAAWKRLADDPTADLTSAQRAQIKARGNRGPQRLNEYGELETMELSHEPVALRDGRTDVVPRWPPDHAAVDQHRHLKNR